MRVKIRQYGPDAGSNTTYLLDATPCSRDEEGSMWGERIILDIPDAKLDTVTSFVRGFKGPRTTFHSRMRKLLDS